MYLLTAIVQGADLETALDSAKLAHQKRKDQKQKAFYEKLNPVPNNNQQLSDRIDRDTSDHRSSKSGNKARRSELPGDSFCYLRPDIRSESEKQAPI